MIEMQDQNNDGVSIVIPCFNSIGTISYVLKSIYLQEFDCPYEILIIDDGSTVPVKHFAEHKKVRYYYKKNSGVSGARNYGVNKAKYKYICFIDSDDIWTEGKIRHQLELIKLHELSFLGTSFDNKSYFNKNCLFKISPIALPLRWWPHISTVIIDKDLFIKLGQFDESMKYAEDGDFLMRVAKSNNLYVTSYNGVSRAIHKSSNYESGLSSNVIRMYIGEIKIVGRYINSIPYKIFLTVFITLKFLIRIATSFARRISNVPNK
jgi:glycosyltransferase involved in cell wall biosynthesis